jgi:hypothetical protein
MFVPIVAAATEMRRTPNTAASTAIEIEIKDFVVRAVPGIDSQLPSSQLGITQNP